MVNMQSGSDTFLVTASSTASYSDLQCSLFILLHYNVLYHLQYKLFRHSWKQKYVEQKIYFTQNWLTGICSRLETCRIYVNWLHSNFTFLQWPYHLKWSSTYQHGIYIIHSLETVIPDPCFPLLSLSNRINSCHSSVLVVNGSLPVLSQLLLVGSPELTQCAMVRCLLHCDGGPPLVVLENRC